MKPHVGLPEESRKAIAHVLNSLLGGEFALYVKTRQFHWNVEGMNFFNLHKMFEAQYEQLDEVVDEIAERVRSLGEYSLGSMAEFIKHSVVEENKKASLPDTEMIKQLVHDHESIIRSIRENLKLVEKYDDKGTEDFLIGLMEAHEKTAWMLRSHLN